MIAAADNLLEVEPIHMNVGAPEHTIGSFGPFTLTTTCEQAGGVEATVWVRTSEPNSTLQANNWYEDFQPGDGRVPFSYPLSGDVPGGNSYGNGTPFDSDGAHAISPSGTSIIGVINPIANFDGAHCYFDGFLIDLS